MNKMILILTLILLSLSAVQVSSAQCPGCVINQSTCAGNSDGELCADTLPAATIQAPYDADVTFHFPRRYTAQAGDTLPGGLVFPALPGFPSMVIMSVLRVNLLSVSGLPPGLSWECDSSFNNCQYIPDLNKQHGCVKICGAVDCDSSGTYQVTFNFEHVLNGKDFLDSLTMGVPFPFQIPLELPNPVSYTVTLVVNPVYPNQLTITANKPTTIGYGESITLAATGGYTSYQWSSGDTISSITVSPTESTLYSLEVTDSVGCTRQETLGITVVGAPSAIASLWSEKEVEIYPNPCNGEFYLNVAKVENAVQVTVYNLIGKRIYEEQIDGTIANKRISLAPFGSGVYYIQLTSGDRTAVKKIAVR